LQGRVAFGRKALVPALGAIVLLPSAAGAAAGARERANDTRDSASAWARANIPAGSTVVVEHLALELRARPWRILYPLGDAGCIDGTRILKAGVQYEKVQKSRKGGRISDLGHVSPLRLQSCSADYAILTYYDLYLSEADGYQRELGTYRQLLGSGRTVALFRPEKGRAGGPTTRVVALRQQVSPKRASAAIDLVR
jgi:hypothetical protein